MCARAHSENVFGMFLVAVWNLWFILGCSVSIIAAGRGCVSGADCEVEFVMKYGRLFSGTSCLIGAGQPA